MIFSALNSSCGQRMQLDGLHRARGAFRPQWHIRKWRAIPGDDENYVYAIALP
jgi:hypothetical protein